MKEIPILEGYLATEEGSIVSARSGRLRTLRSRLHKGYAHVTVRVDDSMGRKQRHRFAVHRLVILAFAGAPPRDGLEVRHLNGCRTDNRPDNLAWGTRQENVQDAIAHGTLGPGMRARHRRLGEQQVRSIVARRRDGESSTTLAKEFGVHPGYIPKLVRGQAWSHLGLQGRGT